MQLYNRIKKYGVHAVMGRPILYEREMRRMNIVQQIETAYKERAAAINWAGWMSQNPEMAKLLKTAQEAYENE